MFRNTIQLIRIKLEKQELQVILEPFISWVFTEISTIVSFSIN